MDERQSFRRAFLAGLLTLGVALFGQFATSKLDAPQACRLRPAASYVQIEPAMGLAQLEPCAQRGLAERVARAVIGAVLNGLA